MIAKDRSLDFGDESHTTPDGRKLTISALWRPAGADSYQTVSRRNELTGERVVTYKRID